MSADNIFSEWFPINEYSSKYSELNNCEGVYRIGFEDKKELKFLKVQNNDKEMVSHIKLKEHYEETDKTILLISNSKDSYLGIESIYELSCGNDVENLKPKTAKIIGQIDACPPLFFSYLKMNESAKEKERLVEDYKQTNGVIPLANKMFNDNDAIPTWSGFNYQGKGVLLKAIQQINSLWDNKLTREEWKRIVQEYSIEIELNEDFVLYEQNLPIQYIQVKATLASETFSGYKTAIKQLIDHRSEGSNQNDAECLLLAARKIRNWDNTCGVDLYLYKDEVIGLLDIVQYIKEEISIFISNYGKTANSSKIDIVYEYLCGILDDRVREIHSKKSGYKMNLYRHIWLEIIIAYEKNRRDSFYEVYEQIYQDSCEVMVEAFNRKCEECKRVFSERNCDTCSIKTMKENFFKMNLSDYAKILKPDLVVNSQLGRKIRSISQAFEENELDSLLYQFQFVNLENYKFELNSHMFNFKDSYTVVPTLLNFRNQLDEIAISTTLAKIQENFAIRKVIDGKILTVEKPGFESQSIANADITSFKKMEDQIIEEDKGKNNQVTSGIKKINVTLVDKMNLIAKLKEESDKNE